MIWLASVVGVQGQINCLRGNCQDQHSVGVYPSGNRYEGDFVAGMPHGLGVLAFTTGDHYAGNFERSYRQGKGRMKFSNGDHYFGHFHQNQMQGYGIMDYADGGRYEGEWMANVPHGLGKLTVYNGDFYEGAFASGMFHGNGRMRYQDGTLYEGDWQFNQRHGRGRFTQSPGTFQDGWWEQDAFVSTDYPVGIKDLAKSDTAYLRNCNLEFCLAGRGSFTYRNGTHYVGDFTKGIPEGSGKVIYNNGDKYEGGWQQHLPHGNGTMYYKSGQLVKAIWNSGRPDKIIDEIVPKDDHGESYNSSDIKVWAVIVGAAQYNHMPALRYTDDDAYQLYAHLKSPQGGAVADNQVRLLIDEDATRLGILQAMNQIYTQADDNDVVLFYFSGHGIEGSFLPIDFDGTNNRIPHQEIKRLVEKSKAKHKIVIADACHSGGIFFRRSTSAQQVLRKYYQAFEQSDGGLALLMSSKGEEYSLEDSGLRSGVFSHFFIKGLKGAADIDASGVVSIDEIYQYIYRNVRMYTGNVQTPQLIGRFDRRMPVGVID